MKFANPNLPSGMKINPSSSIASMKINPPSYIKIFVAITEQSCACAHWLMRRTTLQVYMKLT